MMVRMDGASDELGRTVVVFDPDFVVIEAEKMPALLSKSRAAAFGVIPAVCEEALRDQRAREVLERYIGSPDHILALVNGMKHVKGRQYYVKPETDILPIHIAFFLEPQVPEEVGPLSTSFKSASDAFKAINQRLSQIGSERALLLDRLHVDGEAAPRLAQLADEEASLRRRLRQAYADRKAAGEALWGRLRSLGVDKIVQKLPDGMVTVHVPLIRQDVAATVSGSARGAAGFVYGRVTEVIGYRERDRLQRVLALSRLVRAINAARRSGRAEASIWIRAFLKVSARERFVVMFSLRGGGQGINLVDYPFMPDFETLSQLIPASLRNVYGDALEARAEDVMGLIDKIKPIGDSGVMLPVGLKAVIDFKPKLQAVQQPGEGESV